MVAQESSTLQLFRCVFPEGFQGQEEYLTSLVYQEMSIRAAASAVGELLGKHYLQIYNDVLLANSDLFTPNRENVLKIRNKLVECGWLAWLDKEV